MPVPTHARAGHPQSQQNLWELVPFWGHTSGTRMPPQSLNAAILSGDAQFTAVIRDVLSPHSIELAELDEVLRFIDLISREPFDLVVLDCEGLPAVKQLVSTVRQSSANREA